MSRKVTLFLDLFGKEDRARLEAGFAKEHAWHDGVSRVMAFKLRLLHADLTVAGSTILPYLDDLVDKEKGRAVRDWA